MDNIKEFKVNGTKYGLNLSEIGAVINDGGAQKELKQYIDSKSGGGEIVQNYKGLITDTNTELTKAGDLGYYEVVEYKAKYSKYFTFPENEGFLYLKTPSNLTKTFLNVEYEDLTGDYSLYVNKLNEDGTYTWELIQGSLQYLGGEKIPFTYSFYDETLSKNVEFNGEFAWSLERQEIYYTSTIDGWIPEFKMVKRGEWNEGFYDISEPEYVSKKQGSIYVKDSNGNVINTNSIKKVVEIKNEWNGNPTAVEFFNEVSAAYNEIKEGIENGYEVVVFTNFQEDGTKVQLTDIKATNEVDGVQINGFDIRGFISDNEVLKITIGFTVDSADKQWICVYSQYNLLTINDMHKYATYAYDYDTIVNIRNSGSAPGLVCQFINMSVVDENFYVVKTTVPKWDGSTSFGDNVYKGVLNNGYEYYITKFSGFRIDNEDTFTAEFDLLPDGQWYIIGAEIDFSDKLNYCLVAKAVVTDNGNLDVYFGAYASNDYLSMISVSTVTDYVENYVTFYDCTVNNKFEQGDGGRRSEKNWVVVGTEKIKVDAFDALATYRFIPNPTVENPNQKIRVRCFKRR